MTKTAVVHRDIKEIEWRFLVVEMATKDLKKVRHDVGCFKVTFTYSFRTHPDLVWKLIFTIGLKIAYKKAT